MKVYLSAGHNVIKGRGNGAVSEYGDEGVLAAELRGRILTNVPTLFVDSDSMKLSAVVSDVNRRVGSRGVAVELHFNSVNNKAANGTLCVVANGASRTARRIAEELSEVISGALGTANKGVRTEKESGRSRLAFVRDTLCPAVIVEICFISNKEDMERFYDNKEKLIVELSRYFKGL